MAVADCLKLNVQTRVQDKLCSFGLHYQVASGGSTNDNCKNLCLGWQTACLDKLLDLLAADVSYEGVSSHCLVKNTMLPYSLAGESQPGTSGDKAIPANSALVITLQHADPVALRAGRIFISGIAADNLIDGRWSIVWMDGNVTPFRAEIAVPIVNGGTTFNPVVIQRVQGGIEIEPTPLAIVNTRATDIPYTQRRRTTRQFGWAPEL